MRLAAWIAPALALPILAAPLGKVVDSPDPCPSGPGGVPRTACRQVIVSCLGLKDLRAQVRITEPAAGARLRGTVVLGSGGNGTGFYAGGGPVQSFVRDLADSGFVVVDRAWDGGWVTREGGMKQQACRYATLLTWIHDTVHRGGKFVATGNSGGSAEIGYALTTYGRGDILDVAIPTSGPPLARLDYTCSAEPSQEWAALCARIVPQGAMQCKPGCMLGPDNGVCKQVGPQPTTEQLLEDSVVHPGATLSYPKTRVYFLFGALDCGEPVPAGLTWATKITTQKAVHFVPATPHAIMSTAEGRAAIRKAIDHGTSAPTTPAQSQDQQEFRRRTMELLTPGQRALAQASGRVDRQAWTAAHPPRESTGLIPLPELGKGMYKGEQGGLYPGGENEPPPAHRRAGLAQARKIVPLDASGKPSPDGKIVLVSIGMSNTTMKFQVFQKIAAADRSLNPKLVPVDGAQGGQVAWITANPKMPFWDVVDRRLETAGVTRNQLQAAWVLQANPGPTRPFPAESRELQQNLVDTLHVMQDRFPNLRIAYLSSRTYGGYATSPLNPEPFAYESGFSVKWVIADQIAGKPELNYDPSRGPVRSPWIAWGPYVWADGVKANKDGLSYAREDYTEQDGTHPTPSGRMKVAERLLKFLKTDPTSAPWFLANAARGGAGAQPRIPDSVEVTRDVEYCQGGGHPLLLDVYRPKERGGAPAPAVLWIHGGGWRGGEKSPAPLAVQLAGRGFVAASANYRLSGEAPFPAAIEDCKCAVRFLRANAARYGIDPARIGVAGGSAGGHLALLAGAADESAGLEGDGGWKGVSSRVASVLSWYGPADFLAGHEAFEKGAGPSVLAFLGGTAKEKPENYRRASPVTWVSKDDPPVLMIHGTADTTVPFDQSVRMEKAYRNAGLLVRLIKVDNAEHGFRPARGVPVTPDLQEIMGRSVAFFEETLRGVK